MIHGYTSNKELVDLYMSGRKAFIIRNVQTKDIDEYIASLYILLKDIGFDINKLTQPKIISHKKNSDYTVILLYRASVKNINGDEKLIKKLSSLLEKRILSLNKYVGRIERNSDSSDIAIKNWINSKATCIITFKGNNSSQKLQANVCTKSGNKLKIVVSEGIKNVPKLTIITNNTNDLLFEVLNTISSAIFESSKMLADEIYFIDKNSKWKQRFKVEHNMSGMRIVKD